MKESLKKTLDELKQKYGLKKAIKIVAKLNDFRSMYNDLCPACQFRVRLTPDLPFEEYCHECKQKIEPKLKKINESLLI